MIPFELYPPPKKSWKHVAAMLSIDAQEALLNDIDDGMLSHIDMDFFLNARREQLPPPGDWRIWMIMTGRGFGKNFAGSNWMIDGHMSGELQNSGIVAATSSDLRRYCIEGPSGILAQCPPNFKARNVASKSKLVWPNGTETHYFTAEEPDRLRGPNLDGAWCDELGAWKKADETWNMLRFTLRYRDNPKVIVTTTPRPTPLVKKLLAREGKDVVVTRGSTYDNAANLASDYVQELKEQYEGTRLGRQEISGELLTDAPGALWNYEILDTHRVMTEPEDLIRVVVALDPATTSGEDADEWGINVSGADKNGCGHVIEDCSLRAPPKEAIDTAIEAYERNEANTFVVETNQGGEMITTLIHNVDPALPVKEVHASKGKVARAEPVSAQYHRGRVFHHGTFAKLEDEMCDFVPDIVLERKISPNRVDALVWAMTDLITKPTPRAGVVGSKTKEQREARKQKREEKASSARVIGRRRGR